MSYVYSDDYEIDPTENAFNDKINDLENKIEELSHECRGLRYKLEGAADILASIGHIHDTPHAKLQWIESEE